MSQPINIELDETVTTTAATSNSTHPIDFPDLASQRRITHYSGQRILSSSARQATAIRTASMEQQRRQTPTQHPLFPNSHPNSQYTTSNMVVSRLLAQGAVERDSELPIEARPNKRLRRTASNTMVRTPATNNRAMPYPSRLPNNSSLSGMEPAMMALLQLTEDQGLKCPICHNLMEDATSLPCQHSFCCNCIHRHLTNDQKCPMCKRTSLKSDLQNNIQLNVVIRSARLIRQAQQMPSSLQFPLSALDASLHETSQDVNSNDWALDTAQIQNDQRKAETFQLLGDLFQSLKISLQSKMDTMQRQLTHLEDGIQQAASSAQQYTTNMQMSNIVPDVPTSGHRMGRVVDMNDYHHGDDRGWASIKRSYQDESLMIDPPATPTHANDTISYQHRRRIEQFYPELGDLYLNQVANQPVLDRTQPVGAFSNITSYIETLSQNRTMRSLGRMRYGDSINASAIVSSIEFNVEDTHFALAGVTRKIKLFEINSFCDWMRHHRQVQSEGIIRDSTTDTPHLLPIREITGPNRISCVSWNHYNPVQLASADYDGIVTILDTSSGKPVSAYQEHECRAWSVDYAPNDRTRLASGSDDAKVKIWSTSQATSAMTIYGKANICTVRFSPKDSNILTFGCADHYAYCYDLRYPSEPLYVCQGHRKAISCIRYLDADTFITVSTDASLKSWSHSESGKCLRTYKGHVNDKNFVGLSVSHDGQWISCGSEDNNIYTYFAPLTQPAIVTPFNTTSILRGQESRSNDATLFVSAVAWRRKTNNMIAGNSHGEVKMLELSDE